MAEAVKDLKERCIAAHIRLGRAIELLERLEQGKVPQAEAKAQLVNLLGPSRDFLTRSRTVLGV